MGKNWGIVPGIILLLAIALAGGNGFGADDISADGVDRSSTDDGGIVDVTMPSIITGQEGSRGSYTIEMGDMVTNQTGNTVIIDQYGTLLLNLDSDYINNGITNINAGGTIDNDGKMFNPGAMTFADGAAYTGDGTIDNNGDLTFLSGSIFSNTGAINNLGHLNLHTGTGGASNVIAQTVMSATAVLEITGDAANIGNEIINTSDDDILSNSNSTVIISTIDGGRYDEVDVALSSLKVTTDTTFAGAVDARNITVVSGESTFQGVVATSDKGTYAFTTEAEGAALFTGSAAHLKAGTVNNKGELSFSNNASLTVADTIANSGALSFDSTAKYISSGVITNLDGGTINYHVLMSGTGGIGGFTAAFGRTDLKMGSELFLNGSGTINANLSLIGGEAGSEITIVDGLSFGDTLNVFDSTLYIRGNTETFFKDAVTAGEIIVEDSVGATFEDAVDADLTVKSLATFDTDASFAGHNITVAGGGILNNKASLVAISNLKAMSISGTLNNSGAITVDAGGATTVDAGGAIANTRTFTNNGSLTNAGTFTNDGTYSGSGTLVNEYHFVNNKTFTNQTTSSGAIVNNADAVMWFNSGTVYTASDQNKGRISNLGTLHASAQMSNASLEALFSDLSLGGASTFNLTAGGSTTITGAFVIGEAEDGAVVNIDAGAHSLTFGQNTSLDTRQADLNLKSGAVVLSGSSVITTTGDFTAASGTRIDFSQGSSLTAAINAANLAFDTNGRLDVGEKNILNINTTSGGGTLTLGGTTVVTIADGGRLNVAGASTFSSGSTLNMGEGSVMRVTGDVAFADNTTLHITATTDGISQVISSTGDITVSANGSTEVIFYGTREEIVDKVFLLSESGVVENYQQLKNSLYLFGLDTDGGGQGVYVTGYRSVLDTITETLGGEKYLSINKINGAHHTDTVLATDWGAANADLANYIQEAGKEALGRDKSFAAYSQLFGEYGAYAATPLIAATDNFRNAMQERLNRYRKLTADCNVCVTPVDPCDACGGGVAVTTSNPVLAVARRGNLWGGGFGDWIRQKWVKNIHGYDYNSGGVVLGYDYGADNFTVGIAGAYTSGSLKVDGMGAKYDSDMMNLGLYGTYIHESNVYLRGQFAFGYGWNDYDVGMVLGGKKAGDYNNQSYSAGLEIGYRAELPGQFALVPYAGVEYTHISQDEWTETITRSGDNPILANHFNRQRYNYVDIPVGVRLAKVISMGDVALVPEARAAWVYRANDRRTRINTGYAGSGSTATMYGVDLGPSHGVVGGGVKAVFSDCFDLSLDYTFKFQGGYRDHNLLGTLNISF